MSLTIKLFLNLIPQQDLGPHLQTLEVKGRAVFSTTLSMIVVYLDICPPIWQELPGSKKT